MPSKIINICKNEHADLDDLYHSDFNCNGVDLWGKHPLYYAVRYKRPDVIRILKKLGANIYDTNRINGNDEDLLITAFRTASAPTITCVMLLYDSTYIKTNLANYLPYLFRGDSLCLEKFVKTFKIQSMKGHEFIFCKRAKMCHYHVLKTYNICFDLQLSLKCTLVYARYSAFQYLLTLIRYKEQLDYIYRGPHGCQLTLLSLCCTYGYYNGIKSLIKAGAQYHIMSVNERGETRNNLMALVDNNRYMSLSSRDRIMYQRCLYYLLNFYDINAQNSRGQTALMFAYTAGNIELVQLLLDLGANPDITDMDGVTYKSLKSLRFP